MKSNLKTSTFYGSSVSHCLNFVSTLTKMGTVEVVSWSISHDMDAFSFDIFKIIVTYKEIR